MGIFGPTLLDLAEIYGAEANDIALVNSMRAFGALLGCIVGESHPKYFACDLATGLRLFEVLFILYFRRLFLQVYQ